MIASKRGDISMMDYWDKRAADHTWGDDFEPQYSRRVRLLIIGACALASWGFVALVAVGVLRLLGY